MYSIRSRKVKKFDDDDVATKQDTSSVTTERDADTTRNEPSTRSIKISKKGENSAANSSKMKEKKTKRHGDMKKNQNIDKSYKRKWDEGTKKSEIINKERKAKEDEDMMKSESVDKGNTKKDNDVKKSKRSYDGSKTNANEDMKKSESVDQGRKTKKADGMKKSKSFDEGSKTKEKNVWKPQNIDTENSSEDSNKNRKRKLVEDTNHQKKNDVGDTSNDADTTRNEPSTRAIKISKKGENSAANSSKRKEKNTKRRRDMKKNQNIDKSYKRKWDEGTKKSEIINKESKAKEDEDMMKSESVDQGKKTEKADDMEKPQNIVKGNSSKDSNKYGERKLVEDTNHQKKNDVGDTSNESNEDHLTKMPNEILLKIFSSLTMEDLMNVQSASPKLQAAARDASVWRDFTLKICCTNPLQLKKMPSLRNIEGYTSNSVIKIILDNVIDLRKLDCIFYPDVSASKMKQIVNKYKKLEYIAVDMCYPSALECLQVLKSCKTLQKIKLCFCDDHDCYGKHSRFCSFKLRTLCGPFLGDDNFPLLVNLEVKPCLHSKQILGDPVAVSCLAEIIKSKSQQLKYINISAPVEIDASILEAVNLCTKLQELKIRLFASRLFRGYGIDRLTELRKLNLTVVKGDSDCSTLLTQLSESLKQGSWLNLTDAMFTFQFGYCCDCDCNEARSFNVDLLKSIIDNMKALKSLYLESNKTIKDETQLLNIGDLENLESVRLYGVKVSNTGVSYFSNCRNLRTLMLRTNFPSPNKRRVAEMLCSLEKLESFYLKPVTSGEISLGSQKEIRKWISSVLP